MVKKLGTPRQLVEERLCDGESRQYQEGEALDEARARAPVAWGARQIGRLQNRT